jgi:amidase
MRIRRALVPLVAAAAVATVGMPAVATAHRRDFVLVETTVEQIHRAFARGTLTCTELISGYLARIDAFEDRGPAINSLITLAPDAMAQARALDRKFRAALGKVGPLHCVPVILKDNIDTRDLPTTAGSRTLAGSVPGRDAHVTSELRRAGALILGKGNMDEWAHGGAAGYSSVNGQTRNPYDLTRSPGGSSGGPAMAVAANFAVLAVGTDTLGSIRSPVNAGSLVGVKTTRGLVSGAGIVPFASSFDVAGPMTRTVTDSARLLNVIAGVDREDPRTLAARGRIPRDYTDFLDHKALRGVRVGVLRTYVTGTDAPVIDRAVADLAALGARIVDGIEVPAEVQALQGRFYTFISETEFKNQLGDYLRSRRPDAPVQSHADVLAASRAPGFGIAPVVLARLESEATRGELTDEDYLAAGRAAPAAMRAGIDALLADNHVDVLVHATSSGSALASLSGYPSTVVPAGPNASGVSVGMSFLGRAFSEPQLLGYAYAFEQATRHRQPPVHTP